MARFDEAATCFIRPARLSSGPMLPLRFVPSHRCDEVPNVVVDGSANRSTRLTLSHWPGSPTPVEVRDDLSAQIAFHALSTPFLFDGIDVVTNNHFDQDGLCSVYSLVDPDNASARRALVIDVASAGDFGTFASRDAARIAFALAASEDEDISPLDPAVFAGSYPEQCGRLYEAMLPRFTDLLDHPDRSRALWEREDAHLQASLDAIAKGIVAVDEHRHLDLAVVTVPPDWAERSTHRFTQSREDAVHPMAVNQSTSCLRLALLQGQRYRVECRYETWVMLTSRRVLPRPDLRDLVPRLNEIEPGGAAWRADAPGSLTPRLELADASGESGLSPEQFVSELTSFLATAPAAWDPFNPT